MNQQKPAFAINRLIITLAVCAFVVMGTTSVALFVAPSCRVAALTGWTFLGLPKDGWEGLGTWFGFIAVASGLAYLALNGRKILDTLKTRGFKISREATIALVISVLLAVSLIGDIGPLAAIMEWHEANKHGTVMAATPGGDDCGDCAGGSCGDMGGSGSGCSQGSCEKKKDKGEHGCSGGSCGDTKGGCGGGGKDASGNDAKGENGKHSDGKSHHTGSDTGCSSGCSHTQVSPAQP